MKTQSKASLWELSAYPKSLIWLAELIQRRGGFCRRQKTEGELVGADAHIGPQMFHPVCKSAGG